MSLRLAWTTQGDRTYKDEWGRGGKEVGRGKAEEDDEWERGGSGDREGRGKQKISELALYQKPNLWQKAEDKKLRLTRNIQTKAIMQHGGQGAEQDPGHGVLSVPSDTLCLLHANTHTRAFQFGDPVLFVSRHLTIELRTLYTAGSYIRTGISTPEYLPNRIKADTDKNLSVNVPETAVV